MRACLTWICRIAINYNKMETNFSHEKHVFEFDRVSTTFRLNGISILFDQFILRDRNLINNYNEKIHLDV